MSCRDFQPKSMLSSLREPSHYASEGRALSACGLKTPCLSSHTAKHGNAQWKVVEHTYASCRLPLSQLVYRTVLATYGHRFPRLELGA
jgi:hypothetical protein